MTRYDIFNGDADGLCALHQLRLAEPCESELVTGPKREIGLVKRVKAQAGDLLTVLDVSLDKNRDAVLAALGNGASVRYFDHHQPGEIPVHPAFEPHIDTDADVCTSLLVNTSLGGRHLPWAVTAAFGDNLDASARRAAEPLGLDDSRLDILRELGVCLNYNGYGETLDDLHFDPAELYRQMRPYADPLAFAAESPAFRVLRDGYADDMTRAQGTVAHETRPAGRVFLLPAEKWARRISGVWGNALASAAPQQAHAVLTAKPQGGYVVSVRAPLANKTGADSICSQFETGGGRKGAAGINHLPESDVERFVATFYATYQKD